MGGHAERKHSLLSPSGAHRWMACTPSAMLERRFPDTGSQAAAEGTLAHELAELKVRNLAPVPTAPATPAAVPTAPVTPAPAVPTSAHTYTPDELAKAAMPLMDAGKQQELIGLVHQFGASSIPELRPEQYGAFATALRGMGAQI